jgi:hypothetical protein
MLEFASINYKVHACILHASGGHEEKIKRETK